MAQAQPSERPAVAPRPRPAPDLATLGRAHLTQTPGFYRRSWRRFRQNKVALVSLAVFAVIVALVLGAGLISARVTGFDYRENHLADKLKPPMTDGYLLGSDGNGRDILTRLLYGGRVSLLVAFLSTVATLTVGAAVGLVAGYFGRTTDAVLMRLVDVLLSVPSLPLLILIATLYQPGPVGLALILAAVSWPGIARIVRGEALSHRQRDYVDAARVVGATPGRIIARHVLPNVTPIIVVFASLSIPDLIIAESSLSFLGVGVQVPTPSWGNMLGEATRFFRTNASNIVIPGTAIFVTALTLYLVGSGVRDAFDPRLGD